MMISDMLAKAIKDLNKEAEDNPEIYGKTWTKGIVDYTRANLKSAYKYFKSVDDKAQAAKGGN